MLLVPEEVVMEEVAVVVEGVAAVAVVEVVEVGEDLDVEDNDTM